MDIDAYKEHIYNIVVDIVNQKKIARRHPEHALYGEICERIAELPERGEGTKSAINALCRADRLVWGRTINDFCFKPKGESIPTKKTTTKS